MQEDTKVHRASGLVMSFAVTMLRSNNTLVGPVGTTGAAATATAAVVAVALLAIAVMGVTDAAWESFTI